MADEIAIIKIAEEKAKEILAEAADKARELLEAHAEERIEKVAERAAQLAISGFFINLGVDTSDPLAMQKDFAYLRSWRESIDLVKRRGIISAVTVIVTGILGILYAFFSHKF